jgi:hypothetical protein
MAVEVLALGFSGSTRKQVQSLSRMLTQIRANLASDHFG